jgi:hypothetical protein
VGADQAAAQLAELTETTEAIRYRADVFTGLLKRRASKGLRAAVDPQLRLRTDEVRFAVGLLESKMASLLAPPTKLQDTEYKVFSQWGEDGILQYLVGKLGPPTTFAEIGVADYWECNTRFLMMKDNWRGIVIDSGTAHIDNLRSSETAWRWSIDAVSAFVTADNIDELIAGAGLSDDIGILSIDVDGVDYWLWKAVSGVKPWIVVMEYNSLYGGEHAVTVPYSPTFSAAEAHYSWQFSGASLAALHHLGKAKGYRLVGVCSNGVNAFFVRDDVAADLWDLTPEEAFVQARFRAARGKNGALAFTGSDHRALLRSMRDRSLVRVDTDSVITIGDLYDL